MSTAPDPSSTPTTTVSGRNRRGFAYDLFDDITDGAEILSHDVDDNGITTLVFDGALSPAQQSQVHARLTSTDDDDMADRVLIAKLVNQVKSRPDANLDPLVRLVLRLAQRVLGN